MIPAGIEPVTYRFVAQHLNHEWGTGVRIGWGNLRERDHLAGLGVDGRIILKWVCK